MQSTRKALERVPDDKWNWKPHEKSGTVGWLACHVATMVGWLPVTINTEELDYAPVNGPSYQPPKIENRKELPRGIRQECRRISRRAFHRERCGNDEELETASRRPGNFKHAARGLHSGMVLNHHIHHRAQLTVYYRLLGVSVPGLYGPSADEAQPGAAGAAAN